MSAWRRTAYLLVLCALAAAAAIGLQPVLPLRIGHAALAVLWLVVVAPLIGVAVMCIVGMRFRRARAEDMIQLNALLSKRVRQKERELHYWFERLAAAERSRAVAAERERILRDMHDGVGANLATAMRQLESGRADPGEVAAMLRESLDQLKLAIDAMNLPSGDVNALLASLRYRLQPRIGNAGLALEWRVDELPIWPPPGEAAMRHLQFLLLEAISNALQHANAATLSLGARWQTGHIEITLCDDGCGIDAASTRRLRTMRERAAAIGAGLSVECLERGTRVRVLLPLPAPGASAKAG